MTVPEIIASHFLVFVSAILLYQNFSQDNIFVKGEENYLLKKQFNIKRNLLKWPLFVCFDDTCH